MNHLIAICALFDHMAWKELTDFLMRTQIIRKIIAVGVLVWTLSLLAGLDGEDIALIAIFSGVAGSAATFLFAPSAGKQ